MQVVEYSSVERHLVTHTMQEIRKLEATTGRKFLGLTLADGFYIPVFGKEAK